ncbi:MAG: type I-E CRISPR-associated protein Cas6/Cse3/CasE, partial [Chloroflexota bacterium]
MESVPELYLSRLILNPRNREVRRDLADCQRLHQRIMTGFPGAAGNAP